MKIFKLNNEEMEIKGFLAESEKGEPLAVLSHDSLVMGLLLYVHENPEEKEAVPDFSTVTITDTHAFVICKIGPSIGIGEATLETVMKGSWQENNLGTVATYRAMDKAVISFLGLHYADGRRVVSAMDNIPFKEKHDSPVTPEARTEAVKEVKKASSKTSASSKGLSLKEMEAIAAKTEEKAEVSPEKETAIQTETVPDQDESPDFGVDFGADDEEYPTVLDLLGDPNFGEEIAESIPEEPQKPKEEKISLADTIIGFGKHKGETFQKAGASYLQWCVDNLSGSSDAMKDFFEKAKAYIEEEMAKK